MTEEIPPEGSKSVKKVESLDPESEPVNKRRSPEYEVVLTPPNVLTDDELPAHLCTTRAHMSRVHVLRLLPGVDLLAELQRFASEHNLQAAYVQTCVGSTANTRLRPAGKSSAILFAGKFEIVSLTGTLSSGAHHLHMSIADSDGAVFGGHVMDGCIVRTTAEIVLGLVEGVVFSRRLDERSGYDELFISEREEDSRRDSCNTPTKGGAGSSELTAAERLVLRNIGFWAFITGEDAVGLPEDAPRISFWAYIAGDDRIGCTPPGKNSGFGWLGIL
mmetsp:Transcript_4354/g.8219  ORF Transcript_4354/g.8219 Transcript_4354/m.8219 type:complete len:275 (-) Transcript_4354:215-1039(-)|eukprot:CAMPEP_0114270274 /NCGR_PEP_ID=MMETSP0058-20121206/27142_1 /TAXON_ID=36894 /ORGANISM="Pyramimonas parkeae, CCMP726" /LENGTH=274 /DNA_ID=CAMNT_0001388983 /DNA_START=132 /DNA_END=956 /DNA_ORIENTATION=+